MYWQMDMFWQKLGVVKAETSRLHALWGYRVSKELLNHRMFPEKPGTAAALHQKRGGHCLLRQSL